MPVFHRSVCLVLGLILLVSGCNGSNNPAPPPQSTIMPTQAMPMPVQPAAPGTMAQAADPAAYQGAPLYRLGSGDEVRLTVFGEDSMTGNYKVDGAGMISLPLVGNVMAGGLTVAELQLRIAQSLAQGFLLNPRVSVQVMNYRPFFILGEVNRPNQYPYVEGMKVINAVAMAGGFTYRANENTMIIVHGNDPSRTRQTADPNAFVMPGDSIEVQERLF